MIPIEQLLAFHNSSMTDFQLDRLVTVRAGGTPYGMFFQALRELHKRLRGVRSDYLMRRRLRVKLTHYEALAQGTGYKAELAAIKVDEIIESLEYCEKQIQTDEREFCRFYSQAVGLFVHLGFDREAPTPERLAQLERERWEHTALATIAEHHVNGQPPGSMVSIIQAMPADLRTRVLQRCFGDGANHQDRMRHLDTLANWYLNYSQDLPEPLALSESETREVLLCCESSRLPRLLPISSKTERIPAVSENTETACCAASPARIATA